VASREAIRRPAVPCGPWAAARWSARAPLDGNRARAADLDNRQRLQPAV